MSRALLTKGEQQRNNRYEGIARIGIVMDRRGGKTGPQCRLQYADRGVGSAWTAAAQSGTIGTRDYKLPRKGERVIVLHLPNGPERGVIIGCLYNEAVSAPMQGNPDNRHVEFDDGTIIEYDPGLRQMRIEAVGTVAITANTSLSITAPTVTIKGNVKIEGDLSVDGDVENTGKMDTDGEHKDLGRSRPHAG